MKKILLACTLLLNTLVCLAGDNAGVLWGQGNTFYNQKQYDSAIICFEKITALKPDKADIYFNLGNTYYRMNNIGMAVLNYERALQLKPDYKEAKENLLLTKSRMSNYIQEADDIFFITWWDSLTRGDMATMWAILSFITFSSIILLLFLRRLPKTIVAIPAQVPGILWFIWVCFMIIAYTSALNNNDKSKAVIMQNDAPLMNEDMKGKPLSLLPEGTTVKIKATKGEYEEVLLPDGRKGWVQKSWLNRV